MFAVVGLAVAAVFILIFFVFRRRRRIQRLEHDTAVSAALAAENFRRRPLEDEDHLRNYVEGSHPLPSDMQMNRTAMNVLPSGVSAYRDNPFDEEAGPTHLDPFSDHIVLGEGYPYGEHVMAAGAYPSARTNSPLVTFADTTHNMFEHLASNGVGSVEPLLATFRRTGGSSHSLLSSIPEDPFSDPSTPSPDHPYSTPRSAASSIYASDRTCDDRLDPDLSRQRSGDERQNPSVVDFCDNEDYSRPVLGVSSPITVIHTLLCRC